MACGPTVFVLRFLPFFVLFVFGGGGSQRTKSGRTVSGHSLLKMAVWAVRGENYSDVTSADM